MKKVLGFIVTLFFCIPMNAMASTTDSQPVSKEVDLAPKAKSVILIEQSTGKILYEKNSHEKLAPASMTNVMETKL